MKKKILIITGPTASGKTAVGIRLAQLLNGEIISADSMQVYKYMDIGTAKASSQERSLVKHHMIDEVSPEYPFTAAEFRERCGKYIDEIISRGKLPIVVGGTGLYINSLIKPWDFSGTPPAEDVRAELDELCREKGGEYLYNKLKEADPESAEKIHPNNIKRIMRALEVFMVTGKAKSESDRASMERETEYEPVLIGLNLDRELLYQRINLRIDKMLEEGLLEEVKHLLEMGYSKNLTSMQGLGYKEIVRYLEGEYTLAYAVEILKRDTRRFAKRQLTWFRRYEDIQWYFIDNYEDGEVMIKDTLIHLKEKGLVNK